MIGYDFHPEAETDLTEIWDSIDFDSVHAADLVIVDIYQAQCGR